MLYVHMIPHTHDDVGWLKTVDDLFVGHNQRNQHSTVQLILDSVLEQMISRPNTKFTYAEMKFFSMWYNRLAPDLKSQVKSLVADGRWEIINGGWSENDEACPIFEDIVDNMMVGHQWI